MFRNDFYRIAVAFCSSSITIRTTVWGVLRNCASYWKQLGDGHWLQHKQCT